jgi:3,4-dihydroxy 2-butanone 4-phosphate synthase/GTP cyclohydrolase II
MVEASPAKPVEEVAHLRLPTSLGSFDLHAFRCESSTVYLALVAGSIGDGTDVLTRIHSECLTGDALGSLRCDCGIQLRGALRTIGAEGRGVLVYATNHEGRGIGLINKLLAYIGQDQGLDTVDANLELGLPIDGRNYEEAAAVLKALGVRTVQLMTNNPRKVEALTRSGIPITELRTMPVASNVNNLLYLSTKRDRLGHHNPLGRDLGAAAVAPTDVSKLVGDIRQMGDRPFVVLKYAQTLDGRIATSTGESKWISGPEERSVSHGLRAHCDAILVGTGTVIRDDPQLTVRLVPGSSPIRVVVDSSLRLPRDARVLDHEAPTIVITTDRSEESTRSALHEHGVSVRVVPAGNDGVHLPAALRVLREMGIKSLLVEGGARVITSFLAHKVVDRMIVSVASRILGHGTEAVGDLGITRIGNGVVLTNRTVHLAGEDLLIAADVAQTVGELLVQQPADVRR